jgi:hypothetical protein
VHGRVPDPAVRPDSSMRGPWAGKAGTPLLHSVAGLQ